MSPRGNWDRRGGDPLGRLGSIDRRRFLAASGAGAAALVLGMGPYTEKTLAASRLREYPFRLGVAPLPCHRLPRVDAGDYAEPAPWRQLSQQREFEGVEVSQHAHDHISFSSRAGPSAWLVVKAQRRAEACACLGRDNGATAPGLGSHSLIG